MKTKLEKLQKLIYQTLETCKNKYYENIFKKLCSKAITTKYCWSLLKTMLNGKKFLAYHQLSTVTNLLQILVKKLISLNLFLQNSAQLLKNNSVLPSSTNPITDQYLANIELTKYDIKKSSINSINLMVMIRSVFAC